MMRKINIRLLRSEVGFTLVELMVVVAIIGLLSAVAIPNFQKYQARTKQAEAKLHLSAMYTAESSFYATYTIYHNCLSFMGYNPTEETSSRYYTTGFNTGQTIDGGAYSSALNSGLSSTDCPQSIASVQGQTFFPAGKRVAAWVAPLQCMYFTSVGTQADDTTQVFTVGACGVIHKKFTNLDSQVSLMTINEKKVIQIRRNGF
jgi:type IV pilus assembly protein PilA